MTNLENVRDALDEINYYIGYTSHHASDIINKSAMTSLGVLRKALYELEAYMENGGWSDNMDDAPKDEQFLAAIQGCDTGIIRYGVLEWTQYGFIFDGSEISNAWNVILWKPITPPKQTERNGDE